MSGLLGDLYSFGDRVKRNVRGLLDDPSGTAQQWSNQLAEELRNYGAANKAALDNPNDRNALAQVVRNGMNIAGMAPLGIISGGKIAVALNAIHGKNIDAYLTEGNGPLVLNKIVSTQPGQGNATAFMNDLVAAANENGKTIALSPSGDFGGNTKRLVDFYKRFGFVQNTGRNKDFSISETMYREPQ